MEVDLEEYPLVSVTIYNQSTSLKHSKRPVKKIKKELVKKSTKEKFKETVTKEARKGQCTYKVPTLAI
jgi:hypothetical protein